MKVLLKKMISFICMITIVCSLVGVQTIKVKGDIISGQITDTLEWTIDTHTGVLEISGTGRMNYKCDVFKEYMYDVKEVIIHEGVTSVHDGCFMHFENIEKVTLPESLTFIGSDAFSDCINLKSIRFPEKIDFIGENTFYNCSSLDNVMVPEGLEDITYGVFYGCEGLATIIIPKTVTSISNWAFSGCDNLTNIYYEGTQSEWEKINIGSGNEVISKAEVHYGEEVVETESEEKYYSESEYTTLKTGNITVKYMIVESTIPTFATITLSELGYLTIEWDLIQGCDMRVKINDNYSTSGIITTYMYGHLGFFVTRLELGRKNSIVIEYGEYYAELLLIREGESISFDTFEVGQELNYVADEEIAQFFPKEYEIKCLLIPIVATRKMSYDGSYKDRVAIGTSSKKVFEDGIWDNYVEAAEKLKDNWDKYGELYEKNKHSWGLTSVSAPVAVSGFAKIPEISVMGFIETAYDKYGNVISNSGGLALDSKWKAKNTKQFITSYGPVYLASNITIGLSGNAMLGYTTDGVQIGSGNLKLTPKVVIEGGYGIGDVACLGAYGAVEIPVTIYPPISAELKASAGVHIYVAFLFDESIALKTKIIPINIPTISSYGMIAPAYSGREIYSVIDTSFLDYETEWNGAARTYSKARNISNSNYTETQLKSGILPSSVPEIVQVGDKKVMVFQEYDDTRAELNNTVLKYSVYEAGSWSEPVAVWDNGYADMHADIKVVNDEVVLLWQKVKKTISGDVSSDAKSVIEDIAANSEICFATFDSKTDSFINSKYITNNSEYDLMPNIQEINDNIILSWIRNDSASYSMTDGNNEIYFVEYNGNTLSNESCIMTSLSPISEYSLYDDNGNIQAVLAHTVGKEEILETSKGVKLDSVDGESVTFNVGSIMNFEVVDNILKFIANGTAYEYDILSNEATSYLAGESSFGLNANYFVKGNKQGYVWSQYDEGNDETSIYVSLFTGENYTEPIEIYEKSGVKWNTLSTLVDNSGDWIFLMNETDNTTDINSLSIVTKQVENGISLISANVNEKNVTEEGTEVEYIVINEGEKAVNNLTISVEDSQGTSVSKDVKVELAPGERLLDVVCFDLDDFTNSEELTITVVADEQDDMAKCTVSDTLYRTDIHLSDYSTLKTDEGIMVSVDVINEGGEKANVKLNSYMGENEVVYKESTIEISANAVARVAMRIDYSDIEYIDGVASVKISARSENGDNNENNNIITVYIYETEAEIEINGFQISNVAEGMRTVYSVSDPDSKVINRGLIYGLADYVTEEDMIVDSMNDKVFAYKATEKGIMPNSISELQSSSSYAMTMLFDGVNNNFYEANVMVRAYAELEDGTYIYSDVEEYNVYNIADILYQNQGMTTEKGHDYLFDDILSKITDSYEAITFDTNLLICSEE